MIRRPLPVLDQPISVIGLGCFAIGGFMWGEQDASDSRAALHAGLDAGINWVDTAPLYGSGHAERLLAEVLRERPAAERPLIASKFGHEAMADGSRYNRARYDQVMADCEESLRNLGVECIDLYQLHWPTPDPMEETAAACAKLLQEGKVRAVGVSNFSLAQLQEWQATGVPLASVQNPYSLLRRGDEAEVLPFCAEAGIAYLAYSPMHRGMLFGNWQADKTFPPGDHRAERPDFVAPRLPILLHAVEQLKEIAQAHELSMAQLASGALLSREGCSAVIIGVRNQAQGAALADLGTPLKRVVCEAIDQVLTDLDAALAAAAG